MEVIVFALIAGLLIGAIKFTYGIINSEQTNEGVIHENSTILLKNMRNIQHSNIAKTDKIAKLAVLNIEIDRHLEKQAIYQAKLANELYVE